MHGLGKHSPLTGLASTALEVLDRSLTVIRTHCANFLLDKVVSVELPYSRLI